MEVCILDRQDPFGGRGGALEQGACESVHAIGTLCTLLQGAYMFTGEDGLDSNLLEIDKKKKKQLQR